MPKKSTSAMNLGVSFPDIASEWHETLNDGLRPTDVLPGSEKKIWWTCKIGHEWQAVPRSRTALGTGCPFCSYRRLLRGFNDLQTRFPEIAKSWDSERNGCSADSVLASGEAKRWWICEKDSAHRYQSTMAARRRGSTCAICAGKSVVAGINDLATTCPEFSRDWHPTKNGGFKPTDLTAQSGKAVWWQCSVNRLHAWKSSPNQRKASPNCPYCVNKKVLAGENDLESTHPKIAVEWHPQKNGALSPSDVVAGSGKFVWWQCRLGHEWRQKIEIRTRGHGCPYCSNLKAWPGFNDVATLNPALAARWHTTLNLPVNLDSVLPGSGKKYWWICELDSRHVYQMTPNQGNLRNSGCAICANKQTQSGVNDLETLFPEIAAGFHPTRNGHLTASSINAGSNKKIWWICPLGHESLAQISSRIRGHGCPICSGHQTLRGFNDLGTTHPELSGEWHPTKNLPLTVGDVAAGSHRKVWWVCINDASHVFLAGIDARTAARRTGCPKCAKAGFDPSSPGIFYFLEHSEWLAKKIGITNSGIKTDRLALFRSHGWNVRWTFQSPDGYLILSLETQMLRWIRKELGMPRYLGQEETRHTGGHSETFSSEGITESEVINRALEIVEHLQATKALNELHSDPKIHPDHSERTYGEEA